MYISYVEVLRRHLEGTISSLLSEFLKSDNYYYSLVKADEKHYFLSMGLINSYEKNCFDTLNVDVNIVDGVALDTEVFKK